MKTNELQMEIDKRKEELHHLKVDTENQEQRWGRCMEDIDAIQDKTDRENNDITKKEEEIDTITKSIAEQSAHKAKLQENIDSLDKKKKACVIF
jgi:chromosome segregation ATPase